MRTHLFRPSPPLLALILAWLAVFGAGCGQIITRPTPVASLPASSTPPPTATPAPRPTATPAPYTPEPTATPTLTPTPIIHTIARGETLIAIAGRYGVSLADIQDLNGITDPRRLQVGQQLFIPAPAADAPTAATPTVASTPMPVELSAIHFGNSGTGGLWALGEVANPITVPLEGVRVGLSLLDGEGTPVAGGEALAQTEVITPGGSSPFGIYLDHPPAAFTSYVLQVLNAFPAHVGVYYLDLQTADVVGEGDRFQAYRVRGRVINTGPEDSVEVRLTVTLFDALDRVIGFARAEPEHNVIPRGGETTFDVQVIPLGGPVARVSVSAQGLRIPTPVAGGIQASATASPTPLP
ncbi:MAG: LysM peptidoglycan-binding domain-containing protein [Caldilineales bacterium]|nr:LysM peptidoglycan-binding domain-containing protein [Caldilineales bacterium]MCW5858623.1 LysM peptidoglycan-binding domain-containing protein [Caldilineales bacterium]